MRHQPEENDVADHGGDGDRDEDAPCARKSGADRLLGHVGRRVVAGVGPLRLQQREEERERQRIAGGGAEVERAAEDGGAARRVLRRDRERAEGGVGLAGADQEERADDHQHGADVPPHRRVVQHRHDPDAGDVQDQLDDQEHGHGQELAAHQRPQEHRPVPVGDAEVAQDRSDDRRVDERCGGEVDAGDDRNLAGQVEPGGPPAPVLVLHAAGPVVEAAGGRVRRRDLRHRGRDQQGEDRDERPADGACGRAAPREAVVEQDHRAGQDRDDREADGEVREPAHRPEELLGVTQAVQVVNVLADLLLARLRVAAEPSGTSSVRGYGPGGRSRWPHRCPRPWRTVPATRRPVARIYATGGAETRSVRSRNRIGAGAACGMTAQRPADPTGPDTGCDPRWRWPGRGSASRRPGPGLPTAHRPAADIGATAAIESSRRSGQCRVSPAAARARSRQHHDPRRRRRAEAVRHSGHSCHSAHSPHSPHAAPRVPDREGSAGLPRGPRRRLLRRPDRPRHPQLPDLRDTGRTRPSSGPSSRSRRPRPAPTWPPAASRSSSATPSSPPRTRSSSRSTRPVGHRRGHGRRHRRGRGPPSGRPDARRLRRRPRRQAARADRQLPDRPVPGRGRHQPQHERERGPGQPGHRAAARRRRGLGGARRLCRRQPERPRQHGPVHERRLPDVDAHRHAGPDPRLHAGRRGADPRLRAEGRRVRRRHQVRSNAHAGRRPDPAGPGVRRLRADAPPRCRAPPDRRSVDRGAEHRRDRGRHRPQRRARVHRARRPQPRRADAATISAAPSISSRRPIRCARCSRFRPPCAGSPWI